MTKKIDVTPDWNYDESLRAPMIRAGPVNQYTNGSGQSQLVAVSPVILHNDETPEAISARRKADTKLMLAAPKMRDLLEEIRFAMENAVDNYETVNRYHMIDLVERITQTLEEATHYE